MRQAGSPWVVGALTLLFFGGIAGYKLFIAPEGHSKVTLMRVIQTSRRSLVLAKETVGRGIRYSDGNRLTLVDPVTAQRVARKLIDGHLDYQGQLGGLIWLRDGTTAMLALDPETLEEKMTLAQLVKDHPELKQGIHEVTVDSTRLAFRIVTNDGRSWRLDGASFALTELPPRTPQDEANERQQQDAREKAWTKDPEVRFEGNPRQAIRLADGKRGPDTFLEPKVMRWTPAVGTEARSVLLVTKDSLGKNASIQVVKADPLEGRALWSVSFPGQEQVVGSSLFKDTLVVVTSGEYHTMDDWLTVVSLADGKVQARYQF